MQIIIDIGNSNVVIGVYNDRQLSNIWRIHTQLGAPINWYKEELVDHLFEANIGLDDISMAVLSSVVPELTQDFMVFLESLLPMARVLHINSSIYDKLELHVERKDEIGSDLVANAYAARSRYGQDCIVVDFGTALTFVAVGIDWQIHGVSIAPGLKTAVRALRENTAQLPEVPLEIPDSVLGGNTIKAIQSGVLIGYVGLVEKMVHEYKHAWSADALVIATGGLYNVLSPQMRVFDEIQPNLTLDGMRLIGERILIQELND